jgi:hypothetical protein
VISFKKRLIAIRFSRCVDSKITKATSYKILPLYMTTLCTYLLSNWQIAYNIHMCRICIKIMPEIRNWFMHERILLYRQIGFPLQQQKLPRSKFTTYFTGPLEAPLSALNHHLVNKLKTLMHCTSSVMRR